MNEPLRPMNLGEILDRTALLYRSRFLVFIGISLIPTVVILVPACGFFLLLSYAGLGMNAAPPTQSADTLAVLSILVLFLVAMPAYLVMTALGTAAINQASARVPQEEGISIYDAYKAVWQLKWRYLWLYLLQVLIAWVAPFAVWAGLQVLTIYLAIVAQDAGMQNLAFKAVFGSAEALVGASLIAYGLWITMRLSLAFPACAAERIGAWAAVRRSITLSNGTKGRIFVVYLLGAALHILLSMGITIPLVIAMYLFPWFNDPQHSQTAGVIVLLVLYGSAFAAHAFTRPVYGIALTLFYYDQRIRQEGYDIERMMETAGMHAPSPPLIAEEPAAPESPQEAGA